MSFIYFATNFIFPSHLKVHAPLLIVLILFPLTTTVTLFSLSTLPITAAWPRTLSDLAQLGRDLNLYALSGFAPTLHVLSVLAVSAVWKHAWSIPGSVFWVSFFHRHVLPRLIF